MKRSFSAGLHRIVVAAIEHGLRVPSGLRWPAGLVLIALGLVGFLPILGFWMVPVGVVLLALDVPPWRNRLVGWARRTKSV